jgi:outer membrane protein OmpA-like peptidoglycan-associated protein
MKPSSFSFARPFASALMMTAACGLDRSERPIADANELIQLTPSLPAEGQVINSRNVTFSGRSGAAAGSHVTITATDGRLGAQACSAAVGSDQTWSCAQQLADGGYTWTALITPGDSPTAGIHFVVSTAGLPAPTIDLTQSPTNQAALIATGTVSASSDEDGDGDMDDNDASLLVSENGKALCTLHPFKSGQWACRLPARLADGPHLLTAAITQGKTSSPISNPDSFVVKTSIAAPSVNAVPSPSSVSSPVFSGRGEPAATLLVMESSALLCQSAVAASGGWTCTASSLSDGSHIASASQTDAAGNVSSAVTVTFVIDTHLPAAPTLDAPVSPTSDPRVTFTGSGEAGDQVFVLDAFNHQMCSARVNGAGKWSCAPAGPLEDGDYLLTAFQVTAVGNRSSPSAAQPLSVRTLVAPLFDAPLSPTRDPSPLFTGSAQAGALVAVLLGETKLCSAAADGSGRWSCRPQAPFADGSYLLQEQVSDGSGHSSGPSAARSLVVDTTAPAAPVFDRLISPTRKHRPMLSGSAEAHSAVTVTDADSGAAVCQTSANGAGAFACAPSGDLAAATHRFSAIATDAAGNASPPATPVAVTISDAVPAPPIIASPADGAEVEDNRPLISGRTAQGTSVQVTLDGQSYAAQVDSAGNWTLLPSAELPVGMHHVSAAAMDVEQNVSDSAASSFDRVEMGVARGGCDSGGVPGPVLAVLAFLVAIPRRRSRALALLTALALPSLARAQSPSMDLSTFRPASGGDGYAAVEGARPPLAGESRFELRAWSDYAAHPLMFVTQSGSREVLVRSRAGGFLTLQAHLLGPLSLAAQVPMTFAEQGNLSGLPPSSRGPSSLSGGLGDIRLTPRLALLRQEWAGIDLSAQASLELPTARAQTLTDDGRVRGEGLLALGRRLMESNRGKLDLIGNAFVRLRPPHDFLDVKMGNEAGLRAGLGYLPPSTRAYVPRRVYAEMEARTFLRAGFAAGASPAEWRLGATVCPVRSLAIDVAGGGALTDGVGTPTARFLVAIGWSPSSCGNNASTPLPARAPMPELVAAAPVAPPPPPPALAAAPPPLPDRDGDGIPDVDDVCPDQPGPAENHGCPLSVKQLVIVSASRIDILEQVLFATGKARIERRSYRLLDQVAAVLLSHPDLLLVQVEGYTDDVGSPLRNLALSQARSQAVMAYLVRRGVPANRLRAAGFGESRPIGLNTTPEGRAANRRVAFKVLQTRSMVIEAARPADS